MRSTSLIQTMGYNMALEIVTTCPLGSNCEEVKDGKIHRCSWYTRMQGKDATGKDHDSWKCAIAWQPILQVEVAGTNRNVAASVQSLRNEQTKRQDIAIKQIQQIEGKQREIKAQNHN